MSGEQQQAAPQSQNAIMAAAGRFKDVVANLLKEVSSCRSNMTMWPMEHKSACSRRPAVCCHLQHLIVKE